VESSLPIVLAQAGGGSPLITVGYIAVLFVIMYFLLIRPQQKQAKEHRALMQSLKKGDEVVLQGGILGTIHTVVDDKLTVVEIANGVRVRVLKTAIQGRGVGAQETAAVAKTEVKKEEK
jgi:preprotein translocase subunit YajC